MKQNKSQKQREAMIFNKKFILFLISTCN